MKKVFSQKDFLQQVLTDNGFDFSELLQKQLLHYLDLLQEWNRVFNLTAIVDPRDTVLLHILDSLSITKYLQGKEIIDVGTGAGLPGIPLALTQPEKMFVLLDSNSKKTRFLNQVVYEMKIKNVEIVHARCEDFKPEKCFDSILSRAFASIKVMLEQTQHLLCQDGQFLAMKGIYPAQEIQEIPKNFNVIGVERLNIKGLDAERHLVRVGKE